MVNSANDLVATTNVIWPVCLWPFGFTSNYLYLLKTGSLDNAIREFSVAKPSWYMSHYTMDYTNGERMRDFWAFLFLL